jgi:acetyl-CoA decarbonylase/synthase complex subunit gamma
VETALDFADRLGSWKARWGVGRMRYTVGPGLYAVGNPTAESHVFVTANYKMSFDRLRSELADRDGWIMVLDTRGINVWCAAGAGNFGTDEVVNRVAAVRLSEVVSHRTVILPQLGASGVAAHEVAKRTGFKVIYGPARAEDLGAFLDAGMKATVDMRRVRFEMADRAVLIPMQLVYSFKFAFPLAAALVVLSGLGRGGYSPGRVLWAGAGNAALFFAMWAAAVVGTAALLPWLPGRALSVKGAWLGAVLAVFLAGLLWAGAPPSSSAAGFAGWSLIIVSLSSFLAMTFTGSTPYTSLSGVLREVRVTMPFQIGGAVVGLALWIAGRFV